ncbi:MAG TPA: DedA family protein [Gemmataceae bacterium]|nr:DedA family protein [Gemmataceae bacterium]
MGDAFQTFIDQYATYGYPILFGGVLLENAGIPVPGETAVLVAGFLSSPPGGNRFQIGWVILLTVVAAVIGDNLGFWFGRRLARPRLQQGRRFLFLTPKTLELAESYFDRYGLWTIFFARFITGLRVIGALAAGTAGMPWPKFLLANASGALAWAVTMTLLGYFFGHSWELLHHYLGRGGLIILVTVVLLIGLSHLLHRLRKMEAWNWNRFTRGQIVQGVLVALLEVICVALLVRLAKGHHPTKVDNTVKEWVLSHNAPWVDQLASWGHLPGSLPVVIGVTAILILLLWKQGRSWRESAALVWALVASEAIGLLLVGLLRMGAVEPVPAVLWPFGFAELIPLRVLAVFGTGARVIGHQDRQYGRFAQLGAALLIIWVGFSLVWTGEQLLTEVLLEFVAGGLVLFSAVWWLEGYGPGVVVPATAEPPPPSDDTGKV